jgi:hypothetical protein
MTTWGLQSRELLPPVRRRMSDREARRTRRVATGAPDRIRTCGLRLRRPTLYPAELRARRNFSVPQPSCCRGRSTLASRMPLVVVTRLHLRRKRYLPPFLLYTYAAARQARRATGFITGTLAADAEAGYWAIMVWSDEAAMRAYRDSGAHRRAMPRLKDWCDEASFTHWMDDSSALPTMEVALQRLRASGRVSKVRYPSARHRNGETAGVHVPYPSLPLRRA